MKWLIPPVLFFACVIAMIALAVLAPGSELVARPYNWLGVIAIAPGLALGASGSSAFRRLKTNINTFKDPGVLVTSGVFTLSRNPMYLGFVLVLLGVALILDTAVPFAIALAFFLTAEFWYIRFEEAKMQARFGAEYEAYRKRTRRWI